MDEPLTSSRKLPPDSSSPASEDEFFTRKKRHTPMFDQLERYMSDDSEHLSGLTAYPKLCILFVELNTALPASAAGLIFKPLRACIGMQSLSSSSS